MTTPIKSSYARLAALLWLASTAGCAAAIEPADTDDGEAQAQEAALSQCPPEVPQNLAVPEGNRLAFSFDAVGEQLYVCQQTATGYGWVFRAPVADLFKPNGNIAGTHYVGPTWEALDGSTVVGARVDGFAADPTAIPWLLLRAVSNSEDGRMSKVSFIHRLDTAGGLAPVSGCDADHVNQVQGVDYTAVYYFYVPSSGSPQGPDCEP